MAFITTTVFCWKNILINHRIAPIIIEGINKLHKINKVSIICYVIMPSHIHAIIGFPEIALLSKTIQTFKSTTSREVKEFKINELEKNDYILWKPRFDDLIIYTEEQLKIKMEYIHNNPVKAGLCQRTQECQYSSAIDWLTENHGIVTIDKDYKWLITR